MRKGIDVDADIVDFTLEAHLGKLSMRRCFRMQTKKYGSLLDIGHTRMWKIAKNSTETQFSPNIL